MSMLGFAIACIALGITSSLAILSARQAYVSTSEKFYAMFGKLRNGAIILVTATIPTYIWSGIAYPKALDTRDEVMRQDHSAGWLYLLAFFTLLAWIFAAAAPSWEKHNDED